MNLDAAAQQLGEAAAKAERSATSIKRTIQLADPELQALMGAIVRIHRTQIEGRAMARALTMNSIASPTVVGTYPKRPAPASVDEMFKNPCCHFASGAVSEQNLQAASRVLAGSGLLERNLAHWVIVQLAAEVLQSAQPPDSDLCRNQPE